jgi:hypothetical protein
MAGRYVGFGKKLFDLALGRGKSNVSTTIVGVNPTKNLATKRKIQDNVTEAVDSAFKKADLPPSVRASMETKNKKAALKRDEGKKLKGLSYKLDKLQEKIEKKADGGRIGRRFGSPNPKKTNVQKIKETFGPKKKLSPKQMKIAKLAGNPNKIDGADFKKLRNK